MRFTAASCVVSWLDTLGQLEASPLATKELACCPTLPIAALTALPEQPETDCWSERADAAPAKTASRLKKSSAETASRLIMVRGSKILL